MPEQSLQVTNYQPLIYSGSSEKIDLVRKQSKIKDQKGAYHFIQHYNFSQSERNFFYQQLQSSINSLQLQTNVKNQIIQQQTQTEKLAMKGQDFINSIEHELFILESQKQKNNITKIQVQYKNHLIKYFKNEINSQYSQEMDQLLDLEALFLMDKQIKAWNHLIRKAKKPKFKKFLQNSIILNNKEQETFKLMKLYQVFQNQKQQIKFSSIHNRESEEKYKKELILKVNSNFTNPKHKIKDHVIMIIFKRKAQQKKYKQLLDRHETLMSISPYFQKESDWYEIRELPQYLPQYLRVDGILYYQVINEHKTFIKIEIQIDYHERQTIDKLISLFDSFLLLNQSGIYKLINILKTYNQSNLNKLILFIESNPLALKKVDQTNQRAQQIQKQKVCRRFFQTTVQVMDLFQKSIKNDLNLLFIDFQWDQSAEYHRSFCINPYFGVIKAIMNPTSTTYLSRSNHRVAHSYFQKFSPELFSASFTDYFFEFLNTLTQLNPNNSVNHLFDMPLFMTEFQKQVFITYFQNKVKEIPQKVIQQQRNKKQISPREAMNYRFQQLRSNNAFKTYSYYFIQGAVIQSQMISLGICKSGQNQRLDWITQCSLQLMKQIQSCPQKFTIRDRNDPTRIYINSYSFTTFIKGLRGCIAHKKKYTFDLIRMIEEQYPELLSYLFDKRQVIQNYNHFRHELSRLKGDFLKKIFLKQQPSTPRRQNEEEKSFNLCQCKCYVKKAFDNLNKHQQTFTSLKRSKMQNKIKKFKDEAKRNRGVCGLCEQVLNYFQSAESFTDFLLNLSKFNDQCPDKLGQNHSTERSCYLQEKLENHLVIKYGNGRGATVQHYLIKNWWFFLEITFPGMLKSLQQVKFLLDSQQ